MYRSIGVGLMSVLTSVCDGGGSSQMAQSQNLSELEIQIHQSLAELKTDSDFSLSIVAANGRQLIHNRGNFTPETRFRSASTSKWVTASVIMDLVDIGVLSLDDHPQDYISFWPSSGNLSQISLRHLLRFTSGLNDEPLCVNLGTANFVDCVARIAEVNNATPAPGTEFYYVAAHMQVAGLMAIIASGENSWNEVFSTFQTAHNLFSSSVYDLPSANNPRLAGGMHVSGSEYLALLDALYRYNILTPTLIETMSSDQLEIAEIVYSPAEEGLDVNWHYALGNWIECSGKDCNTSRKFSSLGAYGAYPFIDRQHGYFGILAREGTLGSYTEGYAVYSSVEPLLQQWAKLNQ